jgi:hypothetical protein
MRIDFEETMAIFSGEKKVKQQEHYHCLLHTSSTNPEDKE